MSEHHALPDANQSAFELAAIQLTGFTSLPILTTSVIIMMNYNLKSALLILILGNLILFCMRLAIIAIGHPHKQSALDISRAYMGSFGAYFIALLLVLSTLAWFVVQTTLASNALVYLVPIPVASGINFPMQMSVFLGIISTILCMEGIVVLRWFAMIVMPLLLIAFLAVLTLSPYEPPVSHSTFFSLGGLPLVLGTSLGVTADLPTFFRHSRSWKASFSALIIIQIASFIIGIAGLYLGSVINPWFGIHESAFFTPDGSLLHISLVALVFLSAISANVANVYSASVGWEIIAPVLAGRKEYLILGLSLTIIFILISNIFSLHFLLDTTDSSLVNLCFVLLLGYLITKYARRSPDVYEKTVYFTAWLIGSVINILQCGELFLKEISTLVAGFGIVAIAGVVVFSRVLCHRVGARG